MLVYRPPSSSATCFFDEFSSLLDAVSLTRDRLLILGDFNFHVECASNSAAISFLGLVESYGLTQFVKVPTHKKCHTLDLILSREVDVSDATVSHTISDHHAVECHFNVPTPRLPVCKLSYRPIKLIDDEKFISDWSGLDLITNLASSVVDLVDQFNDGLQSLLDKTCIS